MRRQVHGPHFFGSKERPAALTQKVSKIKGQVQSHWIQVAGKVGPPFFYFLRASVRTGLLIPSQGHLGSIRIFQGERVQFSLAPRKRPRGPKYMKAQGEHQFPITLCSHLICVYTGRDTFPVVCIAVFLWTNRLDHLGPLASPKPYPGCCPTQSCRAIAKCSQKDGG